MVWVTERGGANVRTREGGFSCAKPGFQSTANNALRHYSRGVTRTKR
jgi:hypothetical protein